MCDAALFHRDLEFHLIDALTEIVQRPRFGRPIRRSLAERGGEGLVHFVIGQTQGFSRSVLFVAGFGQRGHLICGRKKLRVDG